MRELVKDREVVCENCGYDRYGRMIGLCRADGVDIQAAMVRAGMAWAFVKYSPDYVEQESAAKAIGWGFMLMAASRRGSGGRNRKVHGGVPIESPSWARRSRLPPRWSRPGGECFANLAR
jgi:endonuclease YncB( thermonuclease family)